MNISRILSGSKAYPCPVCDYVFTLALSLVGSAVMWACDIPWWAIVMFTHYQTASWFLETRK